MTAAQAPTVDPVRVAELAQLGLSWQPSGQAALRGPLLRLAEECDRAFTALAGIWQADEERHPASLPAERLQRVDYLRSFPHQAAFAARLAPEEANLDAFLDGPVLDGDGTIALTELAPVSQVLTPAACYHVFSDHLGESFDAPRYLTTRNTCFRHERYYVPLRRLSSFTMREVVCLGTGAEVVDFLQQARAALDSFFELVDLPLEWLTATDPFFRPRANPRYIMQRVEPVKHEATYGGELAIASINRHHDHFGVNFELTRGEEPAHSGCVAFGIERWLFAITDRHGTDPACWPGLEDAATKVRSSLGEGRT
ncbi:aminoacyl--tRNA ligase-related protein [Streptomyces sp. NPDC020096]